MQIGVVYPQTELGGDPDAVRRIGLAAEELGYDYLLAYDHVLGAAHEDRDPPLWGPYTEHHPFHDPFVMFAYLAGMTERLGFASGVIILPQRQTVLVAKQAADLDLLSGGRLRLGVGVGWNYVEYDALGQDFDTRGPRADEQIGFLRKLWSEDVFEWRGRFDRIDRATLIPKPSRLIPIWIGGFSDPAFRRAALHGDGFQFVGHLERAAPGWDRIRQFAAEAGRDLDDFGRELLTLRSQSADEIVARAEQWRDAGGTHCGIVTMDLGLDSAEAHIDVMGQVRARL